VTIEGLPVTGLDAGTMRLVLGTDSRLMGDGLRKLLEGVPHVEVLTLVDDVRRLAAAVDDLGPDALLISLRTRVPAAISVMREARQIHEHHPDLGIVIVSDRGNGFALELLRGGSARTAYLLDDQVPNIESVVTAVREVLAGQTILDSSVVDALIQRRDAVSIDHLTLRELEVLEQISQGLSNRAVATELGITVKAVENHVSAIFRKLELTGRPEVHQRVSAALTFLDRMHVED
jgi:DNA-binding NarL/FixJ family response regulator